jgi:hypothetical protein
MSLQVPDALLERAEAGDVDDDEFIACVRDSLPYAWMVVSQVAGQLYSSRADFADHAIPPPSEIERGQLLRALVAGMVFSGIPTMPRQFCPGPHRTPRDAERRRGIGRG